MEFRSCLFVCFCNAITFESADVGSSFSLIWYILREYGSSSYMKVIGSRSRSLEQKRLKSVSPQCKTSLSNNSHNTQSCNVYVQHGVFGYGGSNGVFYGLLLKWIHLFSHTSVFTRHKFMLSLYTIRLITVYIPLLDVFN